MVLVRRKKTVGTLRKNGVDFLEKGVDFFQKVNAFFWHGQVGRNNYAEGGVGWPLCQLIYHFHIFSLLFHFITLSTPSEADDGFAMSYTFPR